MALPAWLVYDADERAKEEIAAEKLRGEEEVRKQELETKIAQAKADKLKREEDARQQIKNFNAAAEEARFYAASADPVAENAPTLDAGNAEKKAKESLDIAAQWGPNLEALPLEDRRPGLRKDLYELLLEVAQLKSRRLTDEQVKEVQATLSATPVSAAHAELLPRLRARTARSSWVSKRRRRPTKTERTIRRRPARRWTFICSASRAASNRATR